MSGNITLTNSRISDNIARGIGGGSGGGLCADGNVTLINSTVSGNSTGGGISGGGGGLRVYGNVTLINSTVSGNITESFLDYDRTYYATLGAVTGCAVGAGIGWVLGSTKTTIPINYDRRQYLLHYNDMKKYVYENR